MPRFIYFYDFDTFPGEFQGKYYSIYDRQQKAIIGVAPSLQSCLLFVKDYEEATEKMNALNTRLTELGL